MRKSIRIKDYPHVELTTGLKVAEAKVLYSLGGLDAVLSVVQSRLSGRSVD